MISRALKVLAKELNLPILAAAQLNRDLEKRGDKRPQLSDLRESGDLEQDADVVIFLYQADPEQKSSDTVQTDLIVAKQRNGPVGTISTKFIKTIMRFEIIEHILERKTMSNKTYDTPLPCGQITDQVIAAFYRVIQTIGARRGVPEHAFRDRLAAVLRADGFLVEVEKQIIMKEVDQSLSDLSADLIVEELVVVELKNVEKLTKKHLAQGTLYLDYGGYPAGLILNYGGDTPMPKRNPRPQHYHKEPKKCPGS